MAHPITFKPQPVDPHLELMRRVEAAPREHAEALLVAWDLLQSAHDKGVLDLAQGLIDGKDIVTGKLAEAANQPESIAALRNAIALGRMLGSFDPEVLQRLAQEMERPAKQEELPPSLWKLFRQSTSGDARRGLWFLTRLLTSLGRATRE